MTRSELEHLIRAAGAIADDDQGVGEDTATLPWSCYQ